MPDFSQTTDTASSTHQELQEPSVHYQDQNNLNGIMTLSFHSGIGFSRRASVTPLFLYLTGLQSFSFSAAQSSSGAAFSLLRSSAKNCAMSPSSHSSPLSPGPLWNVGSCLLLGMRLSDFPLLGDTKTLEGGQTLEEPLAEFIARL